MKHLDRLALTTFLSILTILLSPQGFTATTAGRVIYALGQPQATGEDGTTRTLARGNEVLSGDTLVTSARGRLQINMLDGAYISVQPNSEFVVEDYVYSGTPDGTENANYRLVKGGMRALTGLIGKSKPDAYKVHTAVATIGIRGTGHNTRLCQGDCGGTPDGLYHNTWEGITFVENNVDSVDVPTGRGVYVKDINSDIQPLTQAPGATAAVAAEVEEEAEEAEEESNSAAQETEPVFQSGEQQPAGATINPFGKFLMALTGTILPGTPISSSPIITGDFGINNVTGFFNPADEMTGVLFTFDEPGGFFFGEIRTIDLNAMRNASDPAAVESVNTIISAAGAESEIALFEQNPATVAEFFTDSELGIGWGRWANGNVLSILADNDSSGMVLFGSADVIELVDNQSVHFIFGPEPPSMLPAMGVATYQFLGGTQSTSLSGATIGEGVTSGVLSINFGLSNGLLDMDVNHNSNLYMVTGGLFISGSELVFGSSVTASTTASGSACLSSCSVDIIGGLSDETADGFPGFVGFEYTISETDPILGVATFGFESLSSSTVSTYDLLISVEPDLANTGDPVDISIDINQSVFHNDSDQPIGSLFTEPSSGLREVATIDLNAMLGGDDATAVTEVNTLLASADQSVISFFQASPATVAEFFTDGMVGWGRWSGGRVLGFDSSGFTDVDELTGNQSIHFIFGPNPPSLLNPALSSANASYTFTGGTQSTSVSGSTIGTGVTSGFINVNFGMGNAATEFNVNHNSINYLVSGNLFVDTASNDIFDTFNSLAASTSAASSACNPSCLTELDGVFAGPAVGANNHPGHIIFEYDISETDEITGVADFGFDSIILPTSTVSFLPGLVAVAPDASEPDQVGIDILDNTSGFFNANNEPIGILATDEFDVRLVATVDLDAMKGGDNQTVVAELNALAASAPGIDAAIADFETNPAVVGEFFTDSTTGIGWGRWTNGKVLSFDVNGAEVDTLTGTQSLHFVFGSAPPDLTNPALTATATFNLIGSTDSTSANGSSAGNGATSGFIAVDFAASTGAINMTVDHTGTSTIYDVSGPLTIDKVNNDITDVFNSVIATTTNSASACFSGGCNTFIDGAFAGPAGGVNNYPLFIGIEYDIQDTDVVMGVAAFEFTPP